MLCNIVKAKGYIRNKWDWENPKNNIPICLWGPIGVGKTWTVLELVAERVLYDARIALAEIIKKIEEVPPALFSDQ